MKLKSATSWLRHSMSSACLALAMSCGIAGASEVPLVDGNHWVTSSPEAKKAYLIGMANIVQIESAYQADQPVSTSKRFSPTVTKGMQGQTLASVQDAVDKWYAANPDKLQRPVVETIWFEMVVPGLKKTQ